ncbi:MFS transporter [Volucribacter psittacicida]|uniref:MFS transporter n=1 Tax=Volucribacter psittacicida TaxID=203482 RepID=UPI001A9DF7BA|nr:MFS transporter [Volucribacter psittacicida]
MQDFQDQGYVFKPHEHPVMPGSPATPDHSPRRRLFYSFIAILLAITSGLQNGLLLVSLPLLRGELGLDLLQGGWITVAYYITYACIGMLFFKMRQQIGVSHFIKLTLTLLLISNGLQLFFNSYYTELIARGLSGLSANGVMVLSMYYFMQSLTGEKRLVGALLGLGIMQLGTPLGQVLLPFLVQDGEMHNVYSFQFALTLMVVSLLTLFPLPPSIRVKVFEPLDVFVFLLFATAIGCLCTFLVQGRIVWWSTEWLAYFLLIAVLLLAICFWLETHRAKPMLDWHWIANPQIISFALAAALPRIFLSEQSVGAAGLMNALGMTYTEMQIFYSMVLFASALGLVASLLLLNIQDIRRTLPIALLCIAIGAWLDMGANVNTRPYQFYLSQFFIGFASLLFIGSFLLEGMVRALAVSQNHMISFVAVFSFSQTVGGLSAAAGFSAFVTIRTILFIDY